MISYQQRSGDKAVENESTQKNSHFCAARNTKTEGWYERATVLSIVSRLRGDHSFNLPGTKSLRMCRTLHGNCVRDKIRCSAANPWDDSNQSADCRPPQEAAQMVENILYSLSNPFR